MKITIENGVTIINTGEAVGGVKNKHGHTGITFFRNLNKYRASIYVTRNERVHLGNFTNIEDAIAIYEEAEKHIADGTFYQWNETLYGVTKRRKRKVQSK